MHLQCWCFTLIVMEWLKCCEVHSWNNCFCFALLQDRMTNAILALISVFFYFPRPCLSWNENKRRSAGYQHRCAVYAGTPESQLLSERTRLGAASSKRLKVSLRGTKEGGKEQVEIPLTSDATVFKCLQQLHIASSGSTKLSKLRKIWEPTYT